MNELFDAFWIIEHRLYKQPAWQHWFSGSLHWTHRISLFSLNFLKCNQCIIENKWYTTTINNNENTIYFQPKHRHLHNTKYNNNNNNNINNNNNNNNGTLSLVSPHKRSIGDIRGHCIITSRRKWPFLTHPPTLSRLVTFLRTHSPNFLSVM